MNTTIVPILPFLMSGDPSLEALPDHLAEVASLGIGTVELGVPHSDPIADGPVLQAAAHRAIGRGTTLVKIFDKINTIKNIPDVVLFSYFNPLLRMGAEGLLQHLRESPVKALLVVDLPDSEEPDFEAALREGGYPLVPLLAPTTTGSRVRRLLEARPDPGPGACFARRFAYVVARLGVTGTGGETPLAPVARRVAALQGITGRPLAVGFGLSDPGALEAVRAMGATPVVGSALVQALHEGQGLGTFLRPRIGQ
ncbi:MAG: tryptophan synthase subunit alpha [Acidobacteria bacterium]|nr:tryptophan synthase subunit alpha [Acidobacteriota bacterium]